MSAMGTAGAGADDSRAAAAGRWMVILVLLGLMVSPPVAVLGQILLVGLVAVSGDVRGRLVQACREPLAIGCFCFLGVVALGTLYSAAGFRAGLTDLWGWRKLLMVPIGLALFRSDPQRRLLVHVYLAACVVAVAVSFYGYFTQTQFRAPGEFMGTVLRNHSSQSAFFAVGVFAAAALALHTAGRERAWLAAAAVLLAANLLLVTAGRTGFLALVVAGGTFALWHLSQRFGLRRGIAGALVIAAAILVALLASPSSRGRIGVALTEMKEYRQQTELTSMGIRIVFWRNTLPIIAEHPVLGWGTAAFEKAYERQVAGQTGVLATPTRDPHNQYLSVAAQHGLVGLAVFLGFIASAFLQGPKGVYQAIGLSVLAAWCATSLANSHFATFAEGTFLYIWMGAMLARTRDPATG